MNNQLEPWQPMKHSSSIQFLRSNHHGAIEALKANGRKHQGGSEKSLAFSIEGSP